MFATHENAFHMYVVSRFNHWLPRNMYERYQNLVFSSFLVSLQGEYIYIVSYYNRKDFDNASNLDLHQCMHFYLTLHMFYHFSRKYYCKFLENIRKSFCDVLSLHKIEPYFIKNQKINEF